MPIESHSYPRPPRITSCQKMFAKLIPFAICALFMVQAVPRPIESCHNEVQAFSQVDFSMNRIPGPVKIINLGVGGSAFVLGESIVTHIGDKDHGDTGLWKGYPNGPDRYTIKNIGTGNFVSVSEYDGRLVVRPDTKPTDFALESVGQHVWVLKMADEDKVWEAVYDGSSMMYGYVSLRKTPGRPSAYQHWNFTN
ncbi:hypothetical protein DFH07DRAFT_940148 [Mycena maculata]|uniref:Uncharacterized protein n=1 Tax=Mycena maculata TaxID=230809 RepID=A0AAD7J8Z0_9AGAR|nr:hypothetical protein DFH07DRAFT_940148 [Mycena maculata]